jgi:hypothetical protein
MYVHIFMYVYIYMYIYICIYMYIYTYTYIGFLARRHVVIIKRNRMLQIKTSILFFPLYHDVSLAYTYIYKYLFLGFLARRHVVIIKRNRMLQIRAQLLREKRKESDIRYKVIYIRNVFCFVYVFVHINV